MDNRYNQPVFIIPNREVKPKQDLSLEQILYVIGGLLIFFGAFSLVFLNWQNIGSIARTLSVLLGVSLLYSMGYFAKKYSKIEHLDTLMFFSATLFMPMFFGSILSDGFTANLSTSQSDLVIFFSLFMGGIWSFVFYMVFPRYSMMYIWAFFGAFMMVPISGALNWTESYSSLSLILVVGLIYIALSVGLKQIPSLKNNELLSQSLLNPQHNYTLEILSSILIFISITFFTVSITAEELIWLRFLPSIALLFITIISALRRNTYWLYSSIGFLVFNIIFINGTYIVNSFTWPILIAVIGIVIVATGVVVSTIHKKKAVVNS
ncbi:MAG: hypothetical protein WCJ19_05440 [bacterium]